MLYMVAHVHDANETFDVLPIARGSDISVLSPRRRSHMPASVSITTPIVTSIGSEAEERGWTRRATTRLRMLIHLRIRPPFHRDCVEVVRIPCI